MLITSPETEDDWRDYYDLRWQVLRAPWDQPRGSERDALDEHASHCLVRTHQRQAVAVGRVCLRATGEAQVRFMAVLPEFQRQGLGQIVLNELERRARRAGAERLVLNARDTALVFYRKQGFINLDAAPTLYGVITHTRMEKLLGQSVNNKQL